MTPSCLFATDIHGRMDAYEKLFEEIARRRPGAVFLGGDLLPSPFAGYNRSASSVDSFVDDYLRLRFMALKRAMGKAYPKVFLILGNDDSRSEEKAIRRCGIKGLWNYIHGISAGFDTYQVYGYSCVPPTPFLFKDWERYDVSRYVPPGCVSPEDGVRSQPMPANSVRYITIQGDLDELVGDADMERAIFLFHTPQNDTTLDRAGLDGRIVDGVPMDLHVGSIAVRRFIERRQPLLTLHGHIHESTRLTGKWHDTLGRTHMFNAAHDGPELALIEFSLEDLRHARRELI